MAVFCWKAFKFFSFLHQRSVALPVYVPAYGDRTLWTYPLLLLRTLWGKGCFHMSFPVPSLTGCAFPTSFFFLSALTLCVILANGWTDAPNAIASAVSSHALTFASAVRLAAVCNFGGTVLMSLLHPAVAETVFALLPSSGDPRLVMASLCASLSTVVLWAVAAWRFGIPTSESHALIASLSGSALALGGGPSNINFPAWRGILLGMVFSVGLSLFLGRAFSLGFSRLASPGWESFCRNGQILSAAAMAFLHGAQDGQKFIAVFLLGAALTGTSPRPVHGEIPLELLVLCSLAMGLGTALGGRRIIKKVACDMVQLDLRQGLSSDLAAAFSLLFSTVTGCPVSTTHAKTAAILGAGSVSRRSANWKIAFSILWVWLLTFPACLLLGFLSAKFFFLFL